MALDQGHRPSARGKTLSAKRAGKAGADDGHAARVSRRRRVRPCGYGVSGKASGQHLPLGAKAGAFFHSEAGADQRIAHRPGHRPGGERGAGGGQAREFLAERRRPQPRIFFRREAVEKKCVGACLQLRQQLQRVAKEQCEGDAPPGQVQAMKAARQHRPLLRQFAR